MIKNNKKLINLLSHYPNKYIDLQQKYETLTTTEEQITFWKNIQYFISYLKKEVKINSESDYFDPIIQLSNLAYDLIHNSSISLFSIPDYRKWLLKKSNNIVKYQNNVVYKDYLKFLIFAFPNIFSMKCEGKRGNPKNPENSFTICISSPQNTYYYSISDIQRNVKEAYFLYMHKKSEEFKKSKK